MKAILVALFVWAVLPAKSEQQSSNETLEAKTARRLQQTPPRLEEPKANEIKVGPLSYSGIAVEVVKVENRFQLLNPAAPMKYGLADANVVREPHEGKISGLKIFSIQF